MKKTFIQVAAVIIGCMSFIQSTYASTYEFGNFKVSSLRFGDGGVFVTLDPAPDGCQGGHQYGTHFKLVPDEETHYKDMVSGLLTAYTTGTKLSTLWYKNLGTCSNSHVLELYMFKYEQK